MPLEVQMAIVGALVAVFNVLLSAARNSGIGGRLTGAG